MIPNLLGSTIVPKSSNMKRMLEAKEAYSNVKATSLEPKQKETPHPQWMNYTNQ
jgi:hypothetical protein